MTELSDFGKEILANFYPMPRKPTQLFSLKAFPSTPVLCERRFKISWKAVHKIGNSMCSVNLGQTIKSGKRD